MFDLKKEIYLDPDRCNHLDMSVPVLHPHLKKRQNKWVCTPKKGNNGVAHHMFSRKNNPEFLQIL